MVKVSVPHFAALLVGVGVVGLEMVHPLPGVQCQVPVLVSCVKMSPELLSKCHARSGGNE